MADKYKALTDENRRKILKILSKGERPAGEISSKFKIAQPTISSHLRILEEADLVSQKKKAQQRIYSLNKKKIAQVIKELEELL
ncbi:MAG: metalloregulator ArsR/SmtB family transcription factor [Candidatus Dadabacteria bacterium]|nr:metalloregulator ArsR/SmtB family transcription factor [Candidatus Dadabacteria bacterium]NIQ15279.1 metalloregulator ArsR/SmtB family transcription factor [Candidatus Dadabacteria bacterium]